MAENMTGMFRVSCGGMLSTRLPFSSRWMAVGLAPSVVRVSIGSRSGSMDGLVTCEALMSSLSQ